MASRRTPQRGPRSGASRGARNAARPGHTRPGQRGGERGRSDATATERPRFTSRMAVFVLVLAVLVVSYASSMRAYLQQRAHINELHATIDRASADIRALEREKRRWDDDAYVKAQARERLGWVLPGETSYQVIGRDGRPLDTGAELTDPSTVARSVPDPWWSKVYGTVQAADHPKPEPEPATRITPPKPSPSADE